MRSVQEATETFVRHNGELLGNEERRLCIVVPYEPSVSETFIRAHIEKLPAKILLVHGWRPSIGSKTVLPFHNIALHKVGRALLGHNLEREITSGYMRAFRSFAPQAVLAEYGTTGAVTFEACKRLDIPLIVHFHGFDAHVRDVLEEHRETYPLMFNQAAAIVAVSRSMERKLIAMGAPARKVHYNPYGIDCSKFGGAQPGNSPPMFIAVGRFVEKKAPQVTLRAFSQVYRKFPGAQLRMVGDGPLLEECKTLAASLGVASAVAFLGAQQHAAVQAEMRGARCFLQHSVEAASGDCEGTPLGILEAGASGLPVVATRHAGIPDVVIEGETGFLVDEHDVDGMAAHMLRLLEDAALAARMGAAARHHISTHFSQEQSLNRLWRIVESSMALRSVNS
jgi:colanic acid/amylovoran biosynthesis glycosyltransferase